MLMWLLEAPGFTAVFQSKEDLRGKLMEIDEVPKDARLYFCNGKLWIRWEDAQDLSGPERDPLRIKVDKLDGDCSPLVIQVNTQTMCMIECTELDMLLAWVLQSHSHSRFVHHHRCKASWTAKLSFTA